MDQRTRSETSITLKADGTSSYFPAFDYVRFTAALGVFADHAGAGVVTGHGGNACVQIFFALSGFLIGTILLRTTYDDLPRFYFNRSVRIWIPYGIAITILTLTTFIMQGLSDPKLRGFFVYMLTFTYNWFGPQQLAEFANRMPLEGTGNHFWSICVEEQFYLVAPFFIVLISRYLATFLLIGLVALNFVWPHSFAAISLGVLLALSEKRRKAFVAGCGIAFVLLILTNGYEAWMPFLASVIVGVASFFRGTPRPFGLAIGGLSYSFYLNHWIGLFVAHFFVKRTLLLYWPATLIGLLVALLFCYLHYRYVDQYLMRSRSRWYSPTAGLALCLTGYGLVTAGFLFGILVMDLEPSV